MRPSGLRLVREGRSRLIPLEEQRQDHEALIEQFLLSKKLRGHTEGSIYKARLTLQGFFASVNAFAWQVTTEHVKAYHESLVEIELARATRRRYLNDIKQFYEFLIDHPEVPARTPSEQPERVDLKYGVRLVQPVDRWFLPQHSTDDTPVRGIPSRDQLRSFFQWLRKHIHKSRKPHVFARDYAMYRLIYHTGLRENETAKLDLKDLRFDLGTIHVRFGKGTKGSGPRERYVPMTFYGLDKVLEIYLKEVRGHFKTADSCQAVFLSERGGGIGCSTLRYRLGLLVDLAREEGLNLPLFGVHDLRRAFATHLYEEHPDKIEAIRICLGHWNLTTTMKYLRPSAQFVQQQFRDITEARLNRLMKGDDDD